MSSSLKGYRMPVKDYFNGRIPVIKGVGVIWVDISSNLVGVIPSPVTPGKTLGSGELYDIFCQKVSEMDYTLSTEDALKALPENGTSSYYETFKYCGKFGEIEFRVSISSIATIDSVNFMGVYRAK